VVGRGGLKSEEPPQVQRRERDTPRFTCENWGIAKIDIRKTLGKLEPLNIMGLLTRAEIQTFPENWREVDKGRGQLMEKWGKGKTWGYLCFYRVSCLKRVYMS
jgi:hypothetical protein